MSLMGVAVALFVLFALSGIVAAIWGFVRHPPRKK